MLKPFFAALLLVDAVSNAQAQDKVWKHGILEAKSDSGFITMVENGGFGAKHGLKVEILQFRAGKQAGK
jgi:NitT/TauT family transport system substrate-binding protein